MNKEIQQYIPKKYPFPNNWSEREYFIYACFVDDLQSFYKEWVEQGKKSGRIQFFDIDSNGELSHKYWMPSNTCCESGETLTKESIDVKIGYWIPFLWKPIRKDLKQQAIKREVLECQKIDCSCNDCKHLDRGRGWCNKFDRQTSINENLNHPQNQNCFEHRRI